MFSKCWAKMEFKRFTTAEGDVLERNVDHGTASACSMIVRDCGGVLSLYHWKWSLKLKTVLEHDTHTGTHGQREHDDEKYSRSKGVRAGLQINTNNLSVHFTCTGSIPVRVK
jgi:hypothetical protein